MLSFVLSELSIMIKNLNIISCLLYNYTLKNLRMKRMILSIAVIAGMFLMTNLNNVNASEKPTISIVTENDGFVEVDLKDLNEKVQASINELANEYDAKSIKYNTEKQITKVVLIKKDDQSTKKVYLNDNGEKVEKNKDAVKNIESENIETQLPQW